MVTPFGLKLYAKDDLFGYEHTVIGALADSDTSFQN